MWPWGTRLGQPTTHITLFTQPDVGSADSAQTPGDQGWLCCARPASETEAGGFLNRFPCRDPPLPASPPVSATSGWGQSSCHQTQGPSTGMNSRVRRKSPETTVLVPGCLLLGTKDPGVESQHHQPGFLLQVNLSQTQTKRMPGHRYCRQASCRPGAAMVTSTALASEAQVPGKRDGNMGHRSAH